MIKVFLGINCSLTLIKFQKDFLNVAEHVLHLVLKLISLCLTSAFIRIELNYAKYPC